MSQASEAKLNLRNKERKELERLIQVEEKYEALRDAIKNYAYFLCSEGDHGTEDHLLEMVDIPDE